jgi:hypothetical protein
MGDRQRKAREAGEDECLERAKKGWFMLRNKDKEKNGAGEEKK